MICVWVGDTRHVIVDSELEAFQGQWAASLASGRLLSVKGPETGTERLLNPHAVLYAEPYEPPEDPSDERHVLVSGPYWDEERGRWTGECSCGKAARAVQHEIDHLDGKLILDRGKAYSDAGD